MADVGVQLHETLVNIAAFPVLTIVEGNLLGVSQHWGVQGTVLSLELLLIGSQAAERWRDQSDDKAREAVPSEGGDWSLPANQLG